MLANSEASFSRSFLKADAQRFEMPFPVSCSVFGTRTAMRKNKPERYRPSLPHQFTDSPIFTVKTMPISAVANDRSPKEYQYRVGDFVLK